MVSLSVEKADVEKIRDEASSVITANKKLLDDADPQGLKKQLLDSQTKLTELQAKLDAPNRAYQAYLKELSDWQDKRAKIEGTDTDPDSLKGLKAALAALDDVPTKITGFQTEQCRLALEILDEKLAQAAVYRTLYEPVQKFIDTHSLAKDKLKLEFRAELVNEDFSDRLLALIARNRRGSFMGIDEGRAKAESFIQVANWGDKTSVRVFLQGVDRALHFDQRENPPNPVQLHEQLLKGKKLEDVFDLLYGLEFIQPRYILRWREKTSQCFRRVNAALCCSCFTC